MIAVRAIRLVLGLLFACVPVAATAQPVIDIELGQTKVQKAGTTTDIYRFFGGSGTTVKATLIAPGKSALILYTPAGEEMLSATGKGAVDLEAILPLWNVFYIGVVRENGTRPYTLKLTGDEPDPLLALFSHRVGFATNLNEQCWIEPGISKRTTWSYGGTDISTLGRGRFVTDFVGSNGASLSTPKTTMVAVEGDDVTDTIFTGKKFHYTLSSLVGQAPGRFVGMNCDPDATRTVAR